jgi:diguanylate cyclase (GGDEF)-like protein
MDLKVALTIQFFGILLLALLSFSLTGSLKSTALKYWKYAWLALCLALVGLYLALNYQSFAKPFFLIYYLGEYAFAYLLIAGCRNYACGKTINPKGWLMLAAPAVLTVALAASYSNEFIKVFNFHSFIMATAFGIAFFALRMSDTLPPNNTGWRAMRVALALLALEFFYYTIIFSLRHTSYSPLLETFLSFSSIIDLVLQMLLGFGMVIVLLEKVRQDVEETNRKLTEAHDRLEQLAHVDPLTAAFTRHAFYSFLQKQNRDEKAISGCVGVFDIDNLKPINDRFGHAAGDAAISSAARAIRSLVRTDDLIFRWGGDEFFVVMPEFNTAQAVERMDELNALLKDIKLFGAPEKTSIRVSYGFANFSDINNLEKAVKEADAKMYLAKQRGKDADKTEDVSFAASQSLRNFAGAALKKRGNYSSLNHE